MRGSEADVCPVFIGNPANILREVPQNGRLIKLFNPILSNEDLERLRNLKIKDFRAKTLSMGFIDTDILIQRKS